MPQIISELKPQVDELSRSSNNIYTYVSSMSNNLRERQRVVGGEKHHLTSVTDSGVFIIQIILFSI